MLPLLMYGRPSSHHALMNSASMSAASTRTRCEHVHDPQPRHGPVGGSLCVVDRRRLCDVEGGGEAAHQEGLGDARHPLEQAVPAGQEGDQDALDHAVLADDDLLDLHERALEGVGVRVAARRAHAAMRHRAV